LGTFDGEMPVTVWVAKAVEEIARMDTTVRRRSARIGRGDRRFKQ
jgi:hypothetical protein